MNKYYISQRYIFDNPKSRWDRIDSIDIKLIETLKVDQQKMRWAEKVGGKNYFAIQSGYHHSFRTETKIELRRVSSVADDTLDLVLYLGVDFALGIKDFLIPN